VIAVRDPRNFTADDAAWLKDWASADGPGRKWLTKRKGEFVCTQGTEVTHHYMILRGHIGVSTVEGNGKISTLENLNAFSFLHELSHYALHSAMALTDCDLLEFPRETFYNTLESHPPLQRIYNIASAAQVEALRDPANIRLADYFLRMCDDRNADTLKIKAQPKRYGDAIGTGRGNVHKIVTQQFVPLKMVSLPGNKVYVLHRKELKRFLKGEISNAIDRS
jgi:CRP-like cAMP-binding protein